MPRFTYRLLGIALALTQLCAAGRAQTETVLYNFTRSGDGYLPSGSLVADSYGNYYGTTYAGGLFSGQCSRMGFANPGCGTVFEISLNGSGGWTLKTLYQFKGQPDGAAPSSKLVLDSQGNLYGTTDYGGQGGQACNHVGLLGCGTVFRLSPTKSGEWTESLIYDSLAGIGAAYPASLVSDSAGNLYGTLYAQVCSSGTACGYVFKLTPGGSASWAFSIVHSFSGKSDGAGPRGVTVDSSGNLFVTTEGGGTDYGTLVEFTPTVSDSYTMQLLHTFSDSDGRSPLAGVTLDAAGNIYGTASFGGKTTVCPNGCGTVFELSPNSDGSYDFSVLYAFSSLVYGYPVTSLAIDAAGNLYGLGGLVGPGFMFKLFPSSANTWTETVVFTFSFHTDTGASPGPSNGLVVDSSGHLFGTLPLYGTPGGCQPFGCGVVYEITPK